jgi:hypothetical protein
MGGKGETRKSSSKSKLTNDKLPITKDCKITVWSWKDERWSADKETLEAINRTIKLNTPIKYSYASGLDILVGFFYNILRRCSTLAKQIFNRIKSSKKASRK